MRPSEYRRTVKALVRLALAAAPPLQCVEATHGTSGHDECGRPVTHIVETVYGPLAFCSRCATYYTGDKRTLTDADMVELLADIAEQKRVR